jgi:hypothetical protein
MNVADKIVPSNDLMIGLCKIAAANKCHIKVTLKRADWFLTLRISPNLASNLSPPPVLHPLQQLIADNLPAFSDHGLPACRLDLLKNLLEH